MNIHIGILSQHYIPDADDFFVKLSPKVKKNLQFDQNDVRKLVPQNSFLKQLLNVFTYTD